jgi:hypothetical protein
MDRTLGVLGRAGQARRGQLARELFRNDEINRIRYFTTRVKGPTQVIHEPQSGNLADIVLESRK